MTNPENKEIQTQNDEMTMDQLFAEQEEIQDKLNKKEIVELTVVQISQDNVLVDVGSKKEGLIPLSDFEGKETPTVGSTVTAVLVKKGGDEPMSGTSTNVCIRIDTELKAQAEDLFSELGMSLSTAITVYFRQAVRESRIPFEIKWDRPNKDTAAAMKYAATKAQSGEAKSYEDPEELFRDLADKQ